MRPVDLLKKYLNAGAFSQIVITWAAIVMATWNQWYGAALASPFVMKLMQAVQPMYGVPVDAGIIVKYGPPPVITPTPAVMPFLPDSLIEGFRPVITPTAMPATVDPGSHVMPLFNGWWNIFSANNGFGIATPEGLSSMLGMMAGFALPLWAMLGWAFWGSVWHIKTRK